jgi:hypothetical protein
MTTRSTVVVLPSLVSVTVMDVIPGGEFGGKVTGTGPKAPVASVVAGMTVPSGSVMVTGCSGGNPVPVTRTVPPGATAVVSTVTASTPVAAHGADPTTYATAVVVDPFVES